MDKFVWQQKRVNGQTIVNFGCCCSFVHCGFWSIVCMFGGLQLEPVKLLPSIVENFAKIKLFVPRFSIIFVVGCYRNDGHCGEFCRTEKTCIWFEFNWFVESSMDEILNRLEQKNLSRGMLEKKYFQSLSYAWYFLK